MELIIASYYKPYKTFFNLVTLIFLQTLLVACSCSNIPKIKIIKSETFYNNLGGTPENLHPIRSTDASSGKIQGHILESLLQRNINTYQWESSLAKKWYINPNGKEFTFYLHKGLKWSDGKDLTAHDVQFSFEAYKDPQYGGVHLIPYLEGLDTVKAIDKHTVKVKTKVAYFGNFQIIAGLAIIPKHIYKDPSLKLSHTVIGSGAYKIEHNIKGKILVLGKNPFWKVQAQNPTNKNLYQFPKIVFRFIQAEGDALLRLQREALDYTRLTSESYTQKTNKKPWGTTLVKVKVRLKKPKGYIYIGFNLKKPLFQDVRLRTALAHLMNRKLMNEKFNYGYSALATGPWSFQSEYADKTVQPLEFNPAKAKKLLRQAGWKDADKNGILEKSINGKKTELSFEVIYPAASYEKYLTFYQQDLKKAGVKLNIKILEWTTLLRVMNDQKFDTVILGWGAGSVDLDPKQIWHTQSSQKGGSNFVSYSNKKVDALIDKGRSQMDRNARIKTFRKVYRLIAKDVPYIFMFVSPYTFYGVNKRIHRPKDTFNYGVGELYWSLRSQ